MLSSDAHYIFKSPFPRTQEQFQGSSFKPLSLAYHPWVRASQRDVIAPDDSKPRLSFLMQHYHLYGQYPFSPPSSLQEGINNRTEAIIESEDSTSNSGDSPENTEEESTSSEAGSDVDSVTKLPQSGIENIESMIIPPLSYVLRPSCVRRCSSSSSTSTPTFSSTCRSRRQVPVTSPDMGLSAFHDIFSTSISPSDSTIFPTPQNFHRGNRKQKRNSA